jgi:hypothetical protein
VVSAATAAVLDPRPAQRQRQPGGRAFTTPSGGAGNDRLNGGGGNDSLIGGTGIDTAVYGLARANYAITVGALPAVAPSPCWRGPARAATRCNR